MSRKPKATRRARNDRGLRVRAQVLAAQVMKAAHDSPEQPLEIEQGGCLGHIVLQRVFEHHDFTTWEDREQIDFLAAYLAIAPLREVRWAVDALRGALTWLRDFEIQQEKERTETADWQIALAAKEKAHADRAASIVDLLGKLDQIQRLDPAAHDELMQQLARLAAKGEEERRAS